MHLSKVVYTALTLAGKITGATSNAVPNPGNSLLSTNSPTPGTLATHTVLPSILPQIEPHIATYAQQLSNYYDTEKEAKQQQLAQYHEKIAAKVDYDTAGEIVGSAHLYKRHACERPAGLAFYDMNNVHVDVNCDHFPRFYTPINYVDSRYWVYRDVTYAVSVTRERFWSCAFWGWKTCRTTYVDYQQAHRNEKWYQTGQAYWGYYTCEANGLSGLKKVWQNGQIYQGETAPTVHHHPLVRHTWTIRDQCDQFNESCRNYKIAYAAYEACLAHEAQRTTTLVAPSPTSTTASSTASSTTSSRVFLQPSNWLEMNDTSVSEDDDANEEIWFDASSEWLKPTSSTVIQTPASKASANEQRLEPSIMAEALADDMGEVSEFPNNNAQIQFGSAVAVIGGTVAMVGTVGVTYYLCQRHRALNQQPPVVMELN